MLMAIAALVLALLACICAAIHLRPAPLAVLSRFHAPSGASLSDRMDMAFESRRFEQFATSMAFFVNDVECTPTDAMALALTTYYPDTAALLKGGTPAGLTTETYDDDLVSHISLDALLTDIDCDCDDDGDDGDGCDCLSCRKPTYVQKRIGF